MAGPSRHVNCFAGTEQTGNTFPGATLPHGMVQLSPVAIPPTGGLWLYNSGYHHIKGAAWSHLSGFGHTALSGTGLNDGGDFAVLPCVGSCERARLLHDAHETASPGYYSARVQHSDGGHADVELTAGRRSGLMRARFFGPGERRLRIELESRLDDLEPPEGVEVAPCVGRACRANAARRAVKGGGAAAGATSRIRASETGAGELYGTRSSSKTHHCSADHTVYWHATMEPPFSKLERSGPTSWEASWADGILPEGSTLTVRLALSHVSEKGAARNANAELGARPFDFDGLRRNATAEWDAALSLAAVTAEDEETTRTYYTALYHSLLGPTLLADADGRYRLAGRGPTVRGADHMQYSTFSLWDTYRAQSVLLNLIEPQLAPDLANSLLAIASASTHAAGKLLPRWVLFGVETGCMSGYPAAVVLADAALKNLTSRRLSSIALDRMRTTAEHENPYAEKRRPFPPSEWIGVSRALESAVADSCIARHAQALGRSADAAEFAERARLYRKYYDAEAQLLLPRGYGGASVALEGNTFDGDTRRYFEEGTPLQYLFMVPHDARGLLGLLGGGEALAKRLDDYFRDPVILAEPGSQQDLETGNVGGHCQGNEPGHHTPYLYNTAGQPWKTQETVATLLRLYSARADGLPGNDDVGQMSAWYVFSALGLYPVDPCGGTYEIGFPIVSSASISVGRYSQPGGPAAGRTLRILVERKSKEARYVHRVFWQGQRLRSTTLRHSELIKGGTLKFVLGVTVADFTSDAPVPTELLHPPPPPPPPPSPPSPPPPPWALLAETDGMVPGTIQYGRGVGVAYGEGVPAAAYGVLDAGEGVLGAGEGVPAAAGVAAGDVHTHDEYLYGGGQDASHKYTLRNDEAAMAAGAVDAPTEPAEAAPRAQVRGGLRGKPRWLGPAAAVKSAVARVLIAPGAGDGGSVDEGEGAGLGSDVERWVGSRYRWVGAGSAGRTQHALALVGGLAVGLLWIGRRRAVDRAPPGL